MAVKLDRNGASAREGRHAEITKNIARWAATAAYEDIPARVLEKARDQAASVLAAVLAGADSRGGRAAASIAAGGGPAPVLPARARARVEDAVFAAASASMANDFDDYLVFGHTGHSAVLVPLLLATETGASAKDVLTAQVVANEVGGRLGAAMALGPHNGQMWAPIHALASACASARLLGLDEARTADAIGIALYLPPYPVVSGFMGPESKVLTAAWPAVQGVVAARLARAGMTGAHDVLEGPRGMLAAICHAPLPAFFTGFGAAWVTDTLAYKIYPGCAYVDSAVDATLAILRRIGETDGIDPARVGTVDVRATALTIGMEGLAGQGPLSPVRANFSVALSVAIALRHGRLGPAQLEEPALAKEADAISAIASRVRLHHDWDMTLALLRAMNGSLHLGRLLSTVDGAALRRAGQDAVRRTGVRLSAAPRDLAALALAAGRAAAGFAKGALGGASRSTEPYDLGRADLESFTFPIGADVTIRIDGREEHERVMRPLGTPGDWPAARRLVEEKLCGEAARRGRPEPGRRLMDKVRGFEEHPPAEILESVSEIAD